MMIYSIYTIEMLGLEKKLGSCINDGYTRMGVIQTAEAWFEQQAIDDGETGDGEADVYLVSYDDETDKETIEENTLTWCVEEDTYDGGRFDYLAGIGAIRSF